MPSDPKAWLARLRESNEWRFWGVLPRADRSLAAAWWTLLLARGLLPAIFAVAIGALVGAVERGEPLARPLATLGVTFVLLQALTPIHQAVGANLGSRVAAWLYDHLARATTRPPGMGHLENPALATDLTMARDFDLGITGPPMSYAMDFIAGGLVEMVGGLAAALVLFAYAWWAAPVVAGAWLATHWLLRESAVWRDRNTNEVREAQRHADYLYRLAVDPPAAKEIRLFGLADWIVGMFRARRRRLFELRWQATRLRERPVVWSLLLVVSANVAVFVSIGAAAAPTAAVLRLRGDMSAQGALSADGARRADGLPAQEIRFRDVTFSYPTGHAPVLAGFDLSIPAGSSLAIVGVNGAGKTTIAKLLCRLYDPQGGAVEVDGIDLRSLHVDSWRSRVTAVFQDFIRFELPLRDNVAPAGGPDDAIGAALADAGADTLATLDTVLARGYPGGIELSGGQWQRVALARALCAVKLGAGLVLLDEPTAQLDVRGEAEIFDRVLEATRRTTTILISHRFSTVRHADRICVLEQGKVVELGTHDELMAAAGRYKTMFDLQASRFGENAGEVSDGEPLA
jgi:ATP-binding cassette, subfamily B, bacterial